MFCTYGQISSSLLAFTSFYLPGNTADVNDVADWMQMTRFQLNPGKMELLWCTISRCQNRLPAATLTVGSTTVSPVSSVRDLGIFVDSDLVMHT